MVILSWPWALLEFKLASILAILAREKFMLDKRFLVR